MPKDEVMPSTARELVQATIRRKIAKSRKIKEQQAMISAEDVRAKCKRFLREFDDKLKETKSVEERYWLLELEPRLLMKDLEKCDPTIAKMEMMWHGDDVMSLRLEGFRLEHHDNSITTISVIDLIFED